MENLKISEDYKKAYNQADMICRHMPHLLKGITIPENEPTEYTKGFQDRIKQYEAERQKSTKNFSLDKLKDKYKGEVNNLTPSKGKSKNFDKD